MRPYITTDQAIRILAENTWLMVLSQECNRAILDALDYIQANYGDAS